MNMYYTILNPVSLDLDKALSYYEEAMSILKSTAKGTQRDESTIQLVESAMQRIYDFKEQ